LVENPAAPTIDIRDVSTLALESIALPNRTSGVSLSGEGKLAAACCGTQAVVWNLPDQSQAASLPIEQHPDTSGATALLSPSGRHLAVFGGYGWSKIRLMDVPTRRDWSSESIDGALGAHAYSRDEKLLAVASDHGFVALVEVSTGKVLRQLSHELGVGSLAFSADDRTIATTSYDGVSLWHVESGQLMFAFRHGNRVPGAVGFSQDGRRLGYIARRGDDAAVEVYIRSIGDAP
jgi:WD40 repeat protein